MVGHNRKTTNRGAAINRNAERVKKLADETEENFKRVDKAAEAAKRRAVALGERLDALEEFMESAQKVMVDHGSQILGHEVRLTPRWKRVRAWWYSFIDGFIFRFKTKPGTMKGIKATVHQGHPDEVLVLDEDEIITAEDMVEAAMAGRDPIDDDDIPGVL